MRQFIGQFNLCPNILKSIKEYIDFVIVIEMHTGLKITVLLKCLKDIHNFEIIS